MPPQTTPVQILNADGNTPTRAETLTFASDLIYFVADHATDTSGGKELWRTDGTIAGTFQITDFVTPRGPDPDFQEIAEFDGALFFTVDSVFEFEGGALPDIKVLPLWTTDGQPGAERPIEEINPPLTSDDSVNLGPRFYPHKLKVAGDKFYFFHKNILNDNDEIWQMDNASDTATLIYSRANLIDPEWSSGLLGKYSATTANAFFFASDTNDIWMVSNASNSVEKVVSFEEPENVHSATIQDMVTAGDDVFCVVSMTPKVTAQTRWQLWKIHGDSNSTELVREFGIDYLQGAQKIQNLTWSGEYLYFTTSDHLVAASEALDRFVRVPSGLWRTDGTEEGTIEIKENIKAESLTAVDGKLFFASDGDASDGDARSVDSFGREINFRDALRDQELWVSDGSRAGTVRVKDVNPGPEASDPEQLAAIGGTLVFSAEDGETGRSIWLSDGTETGTFLYAQTEDDPEDFVGLGDEVVFTINGELWKIEMPVLDEAVEARVIEDVPDALM